MTCDKLLQVAFDCEVTQTCGVVGRRLAETQSLFKCSLFVLSFVYQENAVKSKTTSTRFVQNKSLTSTTAATDVPRPLSSVAILTNQPVKSVGVENKTLSVSVSRRALQFWKVVMLVCTEKIRIYIILLFVFVFIHS